MSVKHQIHGIMEDLILLCEIRGELDPEANAKIEKRIAELQNELSILEKFGN